MSEYTIAVWQCPGCGEHVIYGGREYRGQVEVYAGAIKQHLE